MNRFVASTDFSPADPGPEGAARKHVFIQKPEVLQPLPRWIAEKDESNANDSSAAFRAGAALFALDQIVKKSPPWMGALRMRQALLCAVACAQHLRLREDVDSLRDAQNLTQSGNDPGPAGNLHRFWRDGFSRPTRLAPEKLEHFAASLGLTFLGAPLEALLCGREGGDPVTAAAHKTIKMFSVCAPPNTREAEILAHMFFDMSLAQNLGWDFPLPLLAAGMASPAASRGESRRRANPGDSDWTRACHDAVFFAARDAHARALDLERRAEKLLSLAPKLRAKNADHAMAALLADDVLAPKNLSGSGAGKMGSERAARRFLERLKTLGAIREFSGRKTFRLYGL